jgi:hypothetical protein
MSRYGDQMVQRRYLHSPPIPVGNAQAEWRLYMKRNHAALMDYEHRMGMMGSGYFGMPHKVGPCCYKYQT